MATKNTNMKFSDEVIGQVAKLLQLAIITGTDIVDNLRMMSVTLDEESGELTLSEDYKEIAESQVAKLMQEIEAFQSESE
tara:strand:+ start:550 stop:789 length:240 start_codon:yes stop_codon:yes gene_type:complete